MKHLTFKSIAAIGLGILLTGCNSSSPASDPGPAPAAASNSNSSITFPAGQAVTLASGQSLTNSGFTLLYDSTGNLLVNDSTGATVWSTGLSSRSCTSLCAATFQTNGDLELLQNNSVYWSTNTSGTGASLTFSPVAPYLEIKNSTGADIWDSGAAATTNLAFSAVYSNDVLSGWPASGLIVPGAQSIYSSTQFASSANTHSTYIEAALAQGPQAVSALTLTARMVNGVPTGFPVQYTISVTSADDSQWVTIGSYSVQPNSSGVATISFGTTVQTDGILIQPTVIGTDPNGNYYFQLVGISAQ